MLFRTNPVQAPTLHELHAEAKATTSAAKSVFHDLVSDMEFAAAQHATVALDAQTEIDELAALRDAASADSEAAVAQARKIAEFLGL